MAASAQQHSCGSTMSEAENQDLFSGLIDGVLTQGDEQRVRLRLERCEACRNLVAELRTIRENALSTRFKAPPSQTFEESPKGPLSRAFRTLGWVLLVVWFAVNVYWVVTLTELPSTGVKTLFALSLGGWTALLISVLIDRVKTSRTDPYRRVAR